MCSGLQIRPCPRLHTQALCASKAGMDLHLTVQTSCDANLMIQEAPHGRVPGSHDEDAPSFPGDTQKPCPPHCRWHNGLQSVQKKQCLLTLGNLDPNPLPGLPKQSWLSSLRSPQPFHGPHDFLQQIKRHPWGCFKGAHVCLD